MLPTIRDGSSGMMKRFDNIFSRMFDDFGDFPVDLFDTQFFGADVFAGDDNTLYVDTPGFNRDNLNVEYQSGVITITGENDFGRKLQKRIRVNERLGEPKTAEVKDGVLKLEYEAPQSEDKKKIELE